MYRASYQDKAGRTRKAQGYFVLNKVNRERYGKIVVARARDKMSAANKIKQKYGIPVTASNLRELPLKTGKMLQDA